MGSYILGYTYKVENYCPDCIIEAISEVQEHIGLTFSVEGVLNVVAGFSGIDRSDEDTFDSSQFPKVIYSWQCEDDTICGACHHKLR